MSSHLSTLAGHLRVLHRNIERFTPNSAVGRGLFAFLALGFAGFSVWPAFLGLVLTGGLGALLSLFVLTVGATVGLLGLVVLWPIYLSLLGQVDSVSEYSTTGRTSSFDGLDEGNPEEDEPLALLKHQYTSGTISEAEFERRLDQLLGMDHVSAERADDARDTLEELERA